MLLYHGSQCLIEKPYYGGGRTTNDYGRGFYCTESESLACEWAVSEKHDGYANCYEFRDDGLSPLNLNGPGYTILHWLSVLLEHRTFDTRYGLSTLAKQYLIENFHVDVEAYDVIRGYRADDSYFSFAQDFISGVISYPQLTAAMRLGKLGEQIVVKSRRAFSRLEFIAAKAAPRGHGAFARILGRVGSRALSVADGAFLCRDRFVCSHSRGDCLLCPLS